MSTVQTDLTAVLKTPIQAAGYELWGYDWAGGSQNSCLCVYIDHPDGISVEDCAKATHQLMATINVDAPELGDYALEVSSPGLDRSLYQWEHYQRFIGHDIKLRLHLPNDDGQRRFQGTISAVDEQRVILKTAQGEQTIPFAQIEKARLCVRWD